VVALDFWLKSLLGILILENINKESFEVTLIKKTKQLVLNNKYNYIPGAGEGTTWLNWNQ